jgi:taurine-pyruvate aminotransferase
MGIREELIEYDIDEMIQQDVSHLWHHLMQHKVFETKEPTIIVEGRGMIVKDIRGREYLDAVSGGVWSVIVGYGRESIAACVAEQLVRMPYYAGIAGNIPTIQLARKLADLLPHLNRVYFSNSGSEANEKAFKLIRQSAHLTGTGRYKILYRDRDYHGTTFAALSATGQQERRVDYEPLVDGFVEFPHACCYLAFGKEYPGCDIDCARVVEEVIQREGPETVGGVIVEPVTAGGGIIPPVPEYYPVLQEICKKYGVLMIMDEVVCGFGRTGKMFGYEHYDVEPDMVTLAKGLASSYMPISATVVSEEVFNLFVNDPGDRMSFFRDISTFGGCAAGSAAALETVRIIEDENLVENSRIMGEYLLGRLQELRDFAVVGDIRGKGLFAGIEIVADRKTKAPADERLFGELVAAIAEEGVLVGRTNRSIPGLNNTINLAPALIVTKDEIDRIVSAIRHALEKANR